MSDLRGLDPTVLASTKPDRAELDRRYEALRQRMKDVLTVLIVAGAILVFIAWGWR